MRKFLVAALGAAAALSMSAAAQSAVFTEADIDIALGADGSISADFGNSGILAGEFTDTWSFTLPQDGRASGSLTSTAVEFGDSTDLDFLEVFFNGVQLFGTTGAQNEAVFANNVPISAGVLNTITITGLSRGNGAYGATGVFRPTAPVPEPATWALLISGFGAVGYSMRSRRRRSVLQAV